MQEPRVIIASNRLPISIGYEGEKMVVNRSLGGLATALASVFNTSNALWVGWAGTTERLTDQQLRLLDFPRRLLPIHLTKELLDRYYDRLSNRVLWPLMHELQPHIMPDEHDWKAVRATLNRFADAILNELHPSDVIWVHDYHLMLLPGLLREAGVSNRIGFFLHTPFPSDTHLLNWPYNRQFLRSLSHCDVVGFQTPTDMINFRINLAASGMQMKEGAIVKDFPIGVDYKGYRAAGNIVKVRSYLAKIKKKLAHKKVILSISRLDYTKGIIEQLQAIEQLLETCKHPERIVYKLIVAPSREDIAEYKRLRVDIDDTVSAINARFALKGFRPIDYSYKSHGFDEVNAWMRLGDVLLVTPHKDGMNLVIKEYIAAKENRRGMVVMSKTAGAAVQLNDAVLVDGRDITAIAEGLKEALTMPLAERRRRWQLMRTNVKEQNVFWWSAKFLEALKDQKR